MKKVLGIIAIFTIGAAVGYQLSDSRFSKIKKHFEELTDFDFDKYARLRTLEERYNKADELLGKVLLLFLNELNIKQAREKHEMMRKNLLAKSQPELLSDNADEGMPKAPVLPIPDKVQSSNNAFAKKKVENKPTSDPIGASYSFGATGLNGVVKVRAPIGKLPTYKMTPECRKENPDIEFPNDSVVTNTAGGLANVFVAIKEGLNPKAIYSVPANPVILNQSGCFYSPHVLAIRVGQPLQILNSDPFLHNVNGLPKINSKFNNGMSTKGSSIEKKFTKAEDAFRIKCDVHPWMNAYVRVFEHPYFSITDLNGRFDIKDLPYGEYLLEVQHEKFGSKEQKVTWAPDIPPFEIQF